MVHNEGKKVVLITGASRGLGRRLSLGFGKSGYRVAVHYRSRLDAAGEVVEEIRAGSGEAVALAAELSDPVQVGSMVERVIETWGVIHVLINNAAVIKDRPVVSMSEQDWDDVLGANLSGPFYAMRAVSGPMQKQGGGEIINIISIAGQRGNSGQANYGASKAGLVGLTRAAARELGHYNIRVNAVSPGFMETHMTGLAPEAAKIRALEQSCLGKLCEPEDVVSFVINLVGMQGVTGQVFYVDSRLV